MAGNGPTSSDDVIALSRVTIGYPGRPIARGIDMSVRRGEFLGIAGPNGGGKTTLLRTLIGLVPPLEGALSYPGGRLRTAYVPQEGTVDELFPLTARDIVMMGRYGALGLVRRPAAADRAAVQRALADVDMSELGDLLLREMSGGQRQRTLIARALCAEPEMLVLDEPTNNMDHDGRVAIFGLLAGLQKERRVTIVMVSHAKMDLSRNATRAILIDSSRALFDVGPVAELYERHGIL
jgi:ABC-type Mn2+/Zn2+ transport system ATPase subunit